MGCKAVCIWEAKANTVNIMSHMGSDCLLHRGLSAKPDNSDKSCVSPR